MTGLEVVNVGGMPTPMTSPLTLALAQTDWLAPADGHLVCPPGLPADAVARVDGELIATIRDHTPTEPGEPLAASTTIVHRAELPEVRRGFDDYQDASARALGAIVIRHPVTLSAPRHLRSLAPGEATRCG
ncbi:MAG: hypothetical protein IPL61_14025 [Myxococcales bacterium]|nr:hypothetical protein [Myxococcales bacterium]